MTTRTPTAHPSRPRAHTVTAVWGSTFFLTKNLPDLASTGLPRPGDATIAALAGSVILGRRIIKADQRTWAARDRRTALLRRPVPSNRRAEDHRRIDLRIHHRHVRRPHAARRIPPLLGTVRPRGTWIAVVIANWRTDGAQPERPLVRHRGNPDAGRRPALRAPHTVLGRWAEHDDPSPWPRSNFIVGCRSGRHRGGRPRRIRAPDERGGLGIPALHGPRRSPRRPRHPNLGAVAHPGGLSRGHHDDRTGIRLALRHRTRRRAPLRGASSSAEPSCSRQCFVTELRPSADERKSDARRSSPEDQASSTLIAQKG